MVWGFFPNQLRNTKSVLPFPVKTLPKKRSKFIFVNGKYTAADRVRSDLDFGPRRSDGPPVLQIDQNPFEKSFKIASERGRGKKEKTFSMHAMKQRFDVVNHLRITNSSQRMCLPVN